MLVGAVGRTGGLFGSSLEIVIHNVTCIGTELTLLDCPLIHSHFCPTEESAVVFCQGIGIDFDILNPRLIVFLHTYRRQHFR